MFAEVNKLKRGLQRKNCSYPHPFQKKNNGPFLTSCTLTDTEMTRYNVQMFAVKLRTKPLYLNQKKWDRVEGSPRKGARSDMKKGTRSGNVFLLDLFDMALHVSRGFSSLILSM